MILLAFAAAALTQWTGPRTEEYTGPGYFCGGGYAIRLAPGDRALVLPQGRGAQGVRLVLGGREVNVWSGAQPVRARPVVTYGGSSVTQQTNGAGVAYTVSDETDFALHVTSDAFRGFNRDRWFFANANFASGVDETVRCLAARSY